MKRLALCLLTLALALLAPVATAQELGEVAFRQALRDMGNDLRLLCMAAHPDDEDGATLALHRFGYGVQTFALIGTRGEGGQNEIGPELYANLGVIRTQEMQAAAQVTGAELLFLDLPEFGYSKTPEETLEIWGHEETLRRMVRVLRQVRPHVIITHHGREKDHGHHQALGQVLLEAFDKAGDPAVFPEEVEAGLAPWQPWRLYIRAWEPGPDSVELDISALDSLRGLTYAQMAAQALELHASQGMTFFIDRYLTGRPKAYYDLVKEALPQPEDDARLDDRAGPLFTGLPTAIPPDRLALSQAQAPRAELKPAVLDALDEINRQQEGTQAGRPWAPVNRAAAAATELRLQAKPDDTLAIPGQTLTLAARLTDFGERDAQSAVLRVEMRPDFHAAAPDPIQRPMSAAGDAEAVFTLRLPEDLRPTVPYAPHLFEPDFLAPQMSLVATVLCGGVEVEVRAPVYIDIAPPIGIEFQDAPYLLPSGQRELDLPVLVTNNTPGPHDAELDFTAPEGWALAKPDHKMAFTTEDEQALITLRLRAPEDLVAGEYAVRAAIAGQDATVQASVHVVDVQVPEVAQVGVVASYDSTYLDVLEKLGIPNEPLRMEDFKPESLDRFTAIIIGMRAYQYRPDLVANNQALLDYTRRGGTVFVNYQKTFDWKPEYAPYPIHVSRNRVTREDAPVTVLAPDHPLLNRPNRLGPEVWEGWIQERGLYFPGQWAQEYTPLLAMSDPGEEIPPGSLLYADYGQGAYIYTSLVWYRQLRALHPGALRFLANLSAGR